MIGRHTNSRVFAMHTNQAVATISSLFFAVLLSDSATLVAAEAEVQPATYQQPQPKAIVKFHQQPARVGDRVSQQLAVQFDMDTKITQSGQTAHQDHTTFQRRQRRLVEVTDVDQGRVRAARVSFSHARIQSSENQDATQLVPQVVEGKSYLVRRQGKNLRITDLQGAIPTQKEFEIVLASVQTLGLRNQLAEFLVRQVIHVGDCFVLPKELAKQVMGFDEQLGQVQKFELELKSLQKIEGETYAQFEAKIAIRGNPSNPIKIDITGQVLIQTATCRTVEANFTGPLRLAVSEASYQVTADGGIEMAMRSQYAISKK